MHGAERKKLRSENHAEENHQLYLELSLKESRVNPQPPAGHRQEALGTPHSSVLRAVSCTPQPTVHEPPPPGAGDTSTGAPAAETCRTQRSRSRRPFTAAKKHRDCHPGLLRGLSFEEKLSPKRRGADPEGSHNHTRVPRSLCQTHRPVCPPTKVVTVECDQGTRRAAAPAQSPDASAPLPLPPEMTAGTGSLAGACPLAPLLDFNQTQRALSCCHSARGRTPAPMACEDVGPRRWDSTERAGHPRARLVAGCRRAQGRRGEADLCGINNAAGAQGRQPGAGGDGGAVPQSHSGL